MTILSVDCCCCCSCPGLEDFLILSWYSLPLGGLPVSAAAVGMEVGPGTGVVVLIAVVFVPVDDTDVTPENSSWQMENFLFLLDG